ncbi:MAG: iron-sulfur cluster repair protein YtfE [Pseudomonadota bacterium]
MTSFEHSANSAGPAPSFAHRRLGEIAVALPGATGVFRRFKLDFCCGGDETLAEAAKARAIELAAVETALRALDLAAPAGLPTEPAALIDHVLARYHAVHRREIPELAGLARKVEAVHRHHDAVPAGLAEALEALEEELGSHMAKEEQVLFPLMRRGGHPMIVHPIAQMRAEHDEHGERLRELERLTHDLSLPADACTSWRALYAGTRKLIDDLMEHIHLENNLLFPHFAGAPASRAD